MGCAPATFSYTTWIQTFPEFAQVSEPRAQMFFTMATVVQRNDGTGPVTDPSVQLVLLNLMTAHVAALYTNPAGTPGAGGAKPSNAPVGRITNAAEGSVSVATDYGTNVGQQQAWCIQTQYGATWWFMTAQYRTFRYVPGALQPGGFGGLGPDYVGYGYGYGPGYPGGY